MTAPSVISAPARIFLLTRGVVAVAMIVRPDLFLGTSSRGRRSRARVVVRVLGVRELIQSGATAAVPTRSTFLKGAVVDGLHSASMLGLAAASPSARAPALRSAASAAAAAAAGVALGGRP